MNVVNVKGKIDNKQNLLPLQFITPSPTKDFLKYYKMFNPHLMKASDFFFKRYEARIDVKEMTSHTYITGRNGSGKTELMKSMIFEFLKERGEECSMVVIDPHGDLSEQISRFEDKDRERFVLFDPYLNPPHTPIFNPFDMEDATLDSIAIKTQNLVKALEEVLKGTEFTNQMLTLLESTIPVLLEKKGSNFLELQRFFDDTRNADLVALGQQSLNAGVKDFFTNRFMNPTYTITKNSLYTKLQSLLNHPTFYKTVNGKSSINLAKLSNSKHHIVFNLSKGRLGDSVSNTIGRLLVAEIQSLALGRVAIEQQERVPTYVFIDEFQNFVSPSIKQILTEARKF